MDANQQDLVAQFSGVTGADPTTAQNALASANWNIANAMVLFYEEQEGGDASDAATAEPVISNPTPQAAPPPKTTPAASSSSSSASSSRRPPQNSSRLRTLQDIQASAHDDDDEDDRDRDLFAGGEKSALAVQNPNSGAGGGGSDHFRNILNQAKQNRDRPPSLQGEDEPAGTGNFSGRAQTLGGDDAPSRVVADPNSSSSTPRARPETISRTLHLWSDGVSVDDGPLFRFDDPANEHIMAQINNGHAPLSLLDVQPNQEVDLALEPHKDQTYVQPKMKYKPFSGQGQRLGAPVPGSESPAAAPPPPVSAPASAASLTPAISASSVNIDESAPTVSLQIRLGDGTRLSSRFNTTHTIGDVYDFVGRAQSNQRSHTLMTTFPSKELTDRTQQLGDSPDLKRGGVVVQKYT